MDTFFKRFFRVALNGMIANGPVLCSCVHFDFHNRSNITTPRLDTGSRRCNYPLFKIRHGTSRGIQRLLRLFSETWQAIDSFAQGAYVHRDHPLDNEERGHFEVGVRSLRLVLRPRRDPAQEFQKNSADRKFYFLEDPCILE
jgi:hypothetical protein